MPHLFHSLTEEKGAWCNEVNEKSVPILLKAVEERMAKYNYLREKFLQAKNSRTIYLFVEDQRWNKLLSLNILKNLRNALLSIRENNENFILLIRSIELETQNIENICIRKSKSYWHGGHRENSILSEFNYISDIWEKE